MSALGGIWTESHKVDRGRLLTLSNELLPFGPDSSGCAIDGTIGMVYRGATVTIEDTRQQQPFRSPRGGLLTWDGRLDNRSDLIVLLGAKCQNNTPDVEIVANALDVWGDRALPQLIGDWCLAFWDPEVRSLLIATDFMGNRRCYYSHIQHEVMWCSALGPLVRLNRSSLHLSDEFIAAYSYKAVPPGLTPYREITLVEPGTMVRLSTSGMVTQEYWAWDGNAIRYKRPGDYDEHFRHVLRTAVTRRLRTDKPALAELSGGVDSSSIVCMAKEVMATTAPGARDLLTISYYDDRDVSGDERPYVAIIERALGKSGWHISLGEHDQYDGPFDAAAQPFPGITPARYSLLLALRRCHDALDPGVVLSGSGGDELLGGLMDPISHIVEHFLRSGRGTLPLIEAWSLSEKETRLNLVGRAVARLFVKSAHVATGAHTMPNAPWLREDLQQLGTEYWRREHELPPVTHTRQPGSRFLRFGLKSLAKRSWNKLYPLSSAVRHTYPYLDRDVVHFLLQVPIAEIYGPGQRRKLMRRALASVTPHEILWRTTKGYTTYSYLSQLREYRSEVSRSGYTSLFFTNGYADRTKFSHELARASHGIQRFAHLLLAGQALDLWLRQSGCHVSAETLN